MIEIRETHEDDFGDVVLLLQQLWPDRSLDCEALRRVFHAALASDSQVYLSACDGPRVVGFASLTVKNNLWQAGNLGHVDELVVDANYRGNGIGTRLLDSVCGEARKKHCARIELDSGLHRDVAHEFYYRLGFERRALLFSKPL